MDQPREPEEQAQQTPAYGYPPAYPHPPDHMPPGYPPQYQVGADIPASDPRHRDPGARPRRNGLAGWLGTGGAAGLGLWKYLAVLKTIPFFYTGISLVVSYALYAWRLGAAAALGIVLMIFVHEMGHVIEIRRQGMRATAPVFIPFMGAAIFQRQMAPDALKQAEIGIAGPIAGTLGATAAFVLYGLVHDPVFLLWAWFGFMINLFNLIPAGMLDGGWILAPVSKWFQVAGLGLIAALFFVPALLGGTLVISPIVLLVIIFGLPATIARFRYADSAYFTAVPAQARWAIGAAWLGLVAYLTFTMITTQGMLAPYLGY